jgi:hypothetical protein
MCEQDSLLPKPTPKNMNIKEVDKYIANGHLPEGTIFLHMIVSKRSTGCFSCFKPYTVIDYNLLAVEEQNKFEYVNQEGYFMVNLSMENDTATLNIRQLPYGYRFSYGEDAYDMTDNVEYATFRIKDTALVSYFDISEQIENAKNRKSNKFIVDNNAIDGHQISFRFV